MRPEAHWWKRAAARDLAMAEHLAQTGYFEGTAFHAQQAAQKAVKAAMLAQRGAWRRTHSAVHLLQELVEAGVEVPDAVLTAARRLDVHYVDSRYPNGVGGAPDAFFDEQIAVEAIAMARDVIDFAQTLATEAEGE